MPYYETHWTDFNSPLFRNEIWVALSYFWPRIFNLPKSTGGIYSEKNTIKYFIDMKQAEKTQNVLMARILKNPRILNDYITLAEKRGKELNKFTKKFFTADLKKWPAEKLINFYKKFANLQSQEYAIGVLLVVLDTSMGLNSLDNWVKKILLKNFGKKEFVKAYEIFTTPVFDSFTREQEAELLKIYEQCRIVPEVFKILKEKSADEALEKFKKLTPKIFNALSRHTKKWAWIYYVYAGPAWQEKDFLEILQDWARRNIQVGEVLNKWQKERQKVTATQKKYLKILEISAREKAILKLASKVVWAKPRRKDYQSKSYWHMERFFRELARRLNISLREARSMPQKMIFEALKSGKVNQQEITKLYDFHVIKPGLRAPIILTGKAGKKFVAKIREEKVEIKGNEFKGSPACPGKARGIVKIINSPEDMSKMQQGNILVSVATTPSIVPAMRRASAILTDEGGLTCHAAIVSRELGIPCVVGLKFITKAVRDEDEVEVEAGKGVVKKV